MSLWCLPILFFYFSINSIPALNLDTGCSAFPNPFISIARNLWLNLSFPLNKKRILSPVPSIVDIFRFHCNIPVHTWKAHCSFSTIYRLSRFLSVKEPLFYLPRKQYKGSAVTFVRLFTCEARFSFENSPDSYQYQILNLYPSPGIRVPIESESEVLDCIETDAFLPMRVSVLQGFLCGRQDIEASEGCVFSSFFHSSRYR